MDIINNQSNKQHVIIHPVVKKLMKKLDKIEREFETAPPLKRDRLMKMYLSTRKKLGIEE